MKNCIPEIIALAMGLNGDVVERRFPPQTPCEEVKVILLTEDLRKPICIEMICRES